MLLKYVAILYQINTVDAGYKNTDYKNMPVIRTLYWKTVTYIPVYFISVIRTPDLKTFRI